MVIVSPITGILPLPNGRTPWLINGGDPNHLLNGMIIQAGAQEGILNPPGVGWWCWYHTADTSVSSHSQNPCKKNGIFYQPRLDFWTINSMGLVYLPTIYHQNHPNPGTYTIPMVPVWAIPIFGYKNQWTTEASFWKNNTLGITDWRSHFLDHKIRSLWYFCPTVCVYIYIYLYLYIITVFFLKHLSHQNNMLGKTLLK